MFSCNDFHLAINAGLIWQQIVNNKRKAQFKLPLAVHVRQQHADRQLRHLDGAAQPEDDRMEADPDRQRRNQGHRCHGGRILSGLRQVQLLNSLP